MVKKIGPKILGPFLFYISATQEPARYHDLKVALAGWISCGIVVYKITRSARVLASLVILILRKAIVVLKEMYGIIQKVPQRALKCVLEPLYNILISLLT